MRRYLGAIASQLEHVLHVLGIVFADFDRLRIGLQIVIAIGQRQTAGTQAGDSAIGILGVGLGAESEQQGDAAALQASHLIGDAGGIFHGSDAIQLRFERSNTLVGDRRGIHAAGVKIANHLFQPSAILFGGGRLQNVGEFDSLVVILEFVETSVACAVSAGQWMTGVPVAARVLIEIGTWIDRRVHGSFIDTGSGSGTLCQGGQRQYDR